MTKILAGSNEACPSQVLSKRIPQSENTGNWYAQCYGCRRTLAQQPKTYRKSGVEEYILMHPLVAELPRRVFSYIKECLALRLRKVTRSIGKN
jgi:hypothetical protein